MYVGDWKNDKREGHGEYYWKKVINMMEIGKMIKEKDEEKKFIKIMVNIIYV